MSGLFLSREDRLGLFISENRYDEEVVRMVFLKFLSHCSRYDTSVSAPPADFAGRAGRFTGWHRLANDPLCNLERAGALRGGDIEVTADREGRLEFFDNPYVEVAPQHFASARTREPAVFLEDGAGRIRWLIATNPFFWNEKWENIPWYEGGPAQSDLLGPMVVVLQLGLLARPRRRAAATLLDAAQMGNGLSQLGVLGSAIEPPAAARPRRLLAAVVIVDLALLLATLLAFRQARETGFLYGVLVAMRLVFVIPPIGAALTVVLGLRLFHVWRE